MDQVHQQVSRLQDQCCRPLIGQVPNAILIMTVKFFVCDGRYQHFPAIVALVTERWWDQSQEPQKYAVKPG